MKNPLIVALDVETLNEAKALVAKLGDSVEIYKIGSQLFTACGPQAVREILAVGKKVFLDLKFHDIPNTVANAVESAVALSVPPSLRGSPKDGRSNLKDGIASPFGLAMTRFGSLFMLTVHTIGGREMLEAAVAAGKKKAQALGVQRPLIVGVTVLTSQAASGNSVEIKAGTRRKVNPDPVEGLTSDAKATNIQVLVLERAKLAFEAGLDGVVASAQEAALIRKELGPDFVIVTPGIRPSSAAPDDQKRVATPKDAISSGSDYLVVGRPIVKAPSPRKAAQEILEEIKRVHS